MKDAALDADPLVADCSGICFPEPPGRSVDVLRALAADVAARRSLELVRAALGSADSAGAARLLEALERTLADLAPAVGARLFGNPLARLDSAPAGAADGAVERRPTSVRAAAVVRHLIGHPDAPELSLVLPAGAIPEGGLFLPHLAVLLRTTEEMPVAVRQDAECLRFVWTDGIAVTLPRAAGSVPHGLRHARLGAAPRASGLPVLNCVAEVRDAFAGFDLATGAELPAGVEAFGAGAALLARAWPEAWTAIARDLKGVVFLAPRGFERSHSPRSLSGAVLLTATGAVGVADTLCHELSHVRLHHLETFGPVLRAKEPERERRGFESPWRADPRPIGGLLAGVHAFLNVCALHRRLFDSVEFGATARAIHARHAAKVRGAFRDLVEHGEPTGPLGQDFVRRLQAGVRAL